MDWIKDYTPKTKQESEDKEHLLALPEQFIGTDRALPYHYTTSSLVLDEKKEAVLMIYHNIYNSWSWPGGHVEDGEDLFYAALRELYEETGLKYARPVSKEAFAMALMPVKSHTHKGDFVDAHFHINFCFGFFADKAGLFEEHMPEDLKRMWVPIKELSAFVTEAHMLPIYTNLIERLMSYEAI